MDPRLKMAAEILFDLVWFIALIALFAFVHHNPPQSSVLEFIIDAFLFIALLAGFSFIHYRASLLHHKSTEIDTN